VIAIILLTPGPRSLAPSAVISRVLTASALLQGFPVGTLMIAAGFCLRGLPAVSNSNPLHPAAEQTVAGSWPCWLHGRAGGRAACWYPETLFLWTGFSCPTSPPRRSVRQRPPHSCCRRKTVAFGLIWRTLDNHFSISALWRFRWRAWSRG